MDWPTLATALGAGLVISLITAPAGVSGAVFLVPVQLSVLGVPVPAVTPTNLLFNVVAAPGTLLGYRRSGLLTGPLVRSLLAGTVPGVMAGAVIRVFVVPGPAVFRLIAAAVLAPLGLRLVAGRRRPAGVARVPVDDGGPSGLPVAALVAVGVVGGVYGIGGGSILGPLLVGRGMAVRQVVPAVLTTTFVTSGVGAATFALLALAARTGAGPEWPTGAACGIGGLIGGYIGARVQPHISELGLRRLLGVLALGLAAGYVVQAVG